MRIWRQRGDGFPVFAVAAAVLLFGPERDSGPWRVAGIVAKVVWAGGVVVLCFVAGREALDRRRIRLLRREPGRPSAGIHPDDRPEWGYSPRSDGSVEIELRLRGRRYLARFADAEKAATARSSPASPIRSTRAPRGSTSTRRSRSGSGGSRSRRAARSHRP